MPTRWPWGGWKRDKGNADKGVGSHMGKWKWDSTIKKSITLKYITFLPTLHTVYHLMYPLTLAVASLIGFTHEYAFQTENHPLWTLFLYSSSANCHVLYKGLCAVAPAIQQNVSLASRLSNETGSLQRTEAEVKLNSGTGQLQKAIVPVFMIRAIMRLWWHHNK